MYTLICAFNNMHSHVEADALDFTEAFEKVLAERFNAEALESLFVLQDPDQMVRSALNQWAMKAGFDWDSASKRGEKFIPESLNEWIWLFATNNQAEISDFFFEAAGIDLDLRENKSYLNKATKAFIAKHVVQQELGKYLLLATLKKFSEMFRGKKLKVSSILDVFDTNYSHYEFMTLREAMNDMKDTLTKAEQDR